MASETDNFFENNLFRFENSACECAVDTKHIAPGEAPETTIKVQALAGEHIQFAFAPTVGLVRLGAKGSLAEKNLLGELIAIKDGDTKKLFEYFDRNGFLFNISDTEYEPIDTQKMFELIERMRATVELLSSVGAVRKDYQKIFGLSLYLTMSGPVEISFSTMTSPYTSGLHPFNEALTNASLYPEPDFIESELYQDGEVTIPDTLLGHQYKLDGQLYQDICAGYGNEYSIPGSTSPLFQSVVLLFARDVNADQQTRRTIDLLFHYFYEVGMIKDVSDDGQIEYFKDPDLKKITSVMKNRILEFARLIISEEINANMSNIHPYYDAEKMTPSWKIDSLLGGLYFSIFYMKPDLELYRRCRQCGKYFLVKATSSKKVYCSNECRNRYQQRMHRKRQKEKEANA